MDFTLTAFEASADLRPHLASANRPGAPRAWPDREMHNEHCYAASASPRGCSAAGTDKWGGHRLHHGRLRGPAETSGRWNRLVVGRLEGPRHHGPASRCLLCGDDEPAANGGCGRSRKGGKLGAFGLTEPGAGSDIRLAGTRGKRVSAGVGAQRQKAFISNAGHRNDSDVTVLARNRRGR